ncbi:MAG TPA: acyltransferase domain-containing protein [Steroidobacteraceae bacterium]|nr:acyltransferase domain-containing protein [Steroidobacteraceae bacterium]
MRVALLFPGQGAQVPGLFARLPQHPAVAATLEEASAVLGGDARRLDEAAELERPASVQLAVVIAGVAASRALEAEGFAADAAAGLSVGAFAAAVASGAVAFADALRLVRLRGAAMTEAVPGGYGMSALVGLPLRQARELIGRVNGQLPLYLASVNAPTEVVVSGADEALALAATEAHAAGAAARRLRVPLPSHCPLMESVSVRLRAAFAGIALGQPRLAYVSNHRARVAADGAAVAEDLILNVSRPVLWHDSITLLTELGCRLFVECPPGAVLSGLVRCAFPGARAVALEEGSLASAVALAGTARGL